MLIGSPSTAFQAPHGKTRCKYVDRTSLVPHEMARIVTAAVYADAEHIVDGIIGLKQRALELVLADDDAAA